MTDLKLIQLSVDGSHTYIMYQVPVNRGIRGKTRGKVNEVLIIGLNTKHLHRFCVNHDIFITNKYVRDSDTEEIILVRKGDTLTYELPM